jgi:hypothetical protein
MHIAYRFIISRGRLAASLILSYQTGSHPILYMQRDPTVCTTPFHCRWKVAGWKIDYLWSLMSDNCHCHWLLRNPASRSRLDRCWTLIKAGTLPLPPCHTMPCRTVQVFHQAVLRIPPGLSSLVSFARPPCGEWAGLF